MFKKVLLALLLAIILVSSLTAAESAWWEGKEISKFEYTGLKNVTQRQVNSLLNKYVGQKFSEELSSEISNLLNDQEMFEFTILSAIQAEDGFSLVLNVEFFENPVIESITYSGNTDIKSRIIQEQQNLVKTQFFFSGLLKINQNLIETFYKGRGYIDVKVKATHTFNEETNKVAVLYEIEEGPQYKVSEIVFEGATAFTAKQLKGQMDLNEKSLFRAGNLDLSIFESDIQKILAFYNQSGYVDAIITGYNTEDVSTEEDKAIMVKITISISEGDQWTYGGITYSGNNVYSNEEIDSIIYLKPGILNNLEEIYTQIQSISSLYSDNGYIQTGIDVQPVRDEDEKSIVYELYITESAQAFIEKIVITGLTKTKPYVIERELTLKVGDLFSQSKLQQSALNIYNTSLVKDIQSGLYAGEEENGYILELALEEGNQMELQFGATFGGNVDGFPVSGFLQWTDKNLGGTGRDFSITTNLSPDNQSLSLSIGDDWVGDKRWSNSISFSAERSVKSNVLQLGDGSIYYDGRDKDKQAYPLGYSSYDEWANSGNEIPAKSNLMGYDFYRIALGYSTGYTWQFENVGSLSLSAGISIGINHAVYDPTIYTPFEAMTQKYNDGWQFSNKLTLSASWDGRDLKENTTRGYLFSTSYTYAGGILGGLSNFNKISLSGAGYLSLFSTKNDDTAQRSHFVASLTSQVSFMLPQFWNNTDSTGWGEYEAYKGATKYEMLYLDGMNVGRGFNTIFDLSYVWHNQLEFSYPLVLNMLNAEAYVSASGVTASLEELSSFSNIDWYFSTGIGIKMKIPGFPLGLYMVKTAQVTDGNSFKWNGGPLFGDGENSGFKLVLALTMSIY